MAREPTDSTPMILRDIQKTLAEHTKMLKEQGADLKGMRREMHEWQESTATALDFAGHANIRIELLQKQVDALTERLERLERQH